MSDDTPKCDKCGLQITTGMMAALCPQALQCEFWPHSDGAPAMDGAELFMARAWIGNAVEQIGLQIEDRKRLCSQIEELERGRDFDRAVGMTPITYEELMDTTESTAAVASTIEARFPDIDIADGEHYAGLSRDHDTGAWHHVVLLPATPDKRLTWQQAIDWAKSVGGALPTRFESALLYANLRDKLDLDNWHWTATPYAGDERYAWTQSFSYGGQDPSHKDYDYRAVAVRRVPV